MIDFNSKTFLTDRVNHLIDREIDKTGEKSQRRGYLGASVIGHECDRAVQYHLMAARGVIERKRPAARNLRIFDRGHTYEEKARQWLQYAGFVFARPMGFADLGGEYRGNIDGAVRWWDGKGECPVALPFLWECKCLGAKYWKQISEKGLKAYSSTYWAQVHQYMGYCELPRCLYTVINADTMELFHAVYDFDPVEAGLGRTRAAGIIAATNEGRLVARCTGDPNFYKCKSLCDFREICWSA